MKKAAILVVEDEAVVAMDIEAVLQDLGYTVVGTAATGEEAISKAAEHHPDLVLMDIRLRGAMDGIEAARQIRVQAATPIVYLTAFADEEIITRAKITEPFGYILKPFQARELHSNIEMALYKQAMENRLRESRDSLARSLRGTVNTIARLVELRDPFIKEHHQRVMRLAVAIAMRMELDGDRIEGIRLAATIHDLGLVRLPFEVLSKRGALTAAENALYESHSEVGYEVLKDIDFPWPVAMIVRQHHEFLDGSGFPAHLKGDAILLESRIVNVANTIDRMVSGRPQQAAVGVEQALQWLIGNQGKLFDAEAVTQCVRLFREMHFQLE